MPEYILGEQVFPPGKENDFLGGAKAFSVSFSARDDAEAIKKAFAVVKRKKKMSAAKGKKVKATLYRRGEYMIRNFPT